MSKKKYFFFDIDGTLTNGVDAGISKETVACLKQLEDNGHLVAIATGRPYKLALDAAKELGIKHFVCEGGHSVCYDYEIVETKPMDREKCVALCLQADKLGAKLSFMNDQDGQIYSKKKEYVSHFHYNMFNVVIDDTLNYETVENFYRIFIDLDSVEIDQLPYLDDLGYLVEPHNKKGLVIEPNVKFEGIEKMVKYLNGDINEVVVFGDGMNDISMFQHSPFSVAMGNGIDELKRIANFVTKRNDENGIVYACKHFGWVY